MKRNTNTSKVVNTCSKRRVVLKSAVLSGSALSILPSAWTKPIVNSVIMPAHAQTSLPCPEVIVGNSAFSVGSAAGTCGLSFEFLSADAAMPLNILSIQNSAPVGTDAVTYASGTTGVVTSVSGLSVNWVGQSVGAPFACNTDTPVPVNDITFIVSYNCDNNSEVQTMSFDLIAVAAGL